MINRENYIMVRKFLTYMKDVRQRDDETIHTYWEGLRHVLKWSDKRHFSEVEKIRPVLPEFIITDREDGKSGQLSAKYQGKVLSHARMFFDWARISLPDMGKIPETYTATLVLRRSIAAGRIRKRIYYTLEEVQKIASMKPENLREERDIAAICFVFLCGIRAGAFVSLPCEAVEIENRRVIQSPEIGVKTKNSKAAVTFLLPIDDLVKVVEAWDAKVKVLGAGTHWFARIAYNAKNGEYRFADTREVIQYEKDRENVFRKGLKAFCERAGIPYKSPHKLRHGFGVYGVKHAKDIGQLKAISQNLMHANIGITDGIYGNLGEDDLKEIISNFGK